METRFQIWLRRFIRENDLSIKATADRLGLNHAQVSRYVSGKREPSYSTLADIVRLTGANPLEWF